MKPCSVCPHSYNPLPADGPTPSRLLFIGERPGETENNLQQVFVGKSGEELDHTYLRLAGYKRDEVRVTNTVRCWAENNKTPTEKEADICGHHHLPREIARCNPEVVVLLGATACSLAGDLINLETHHGRPLKVKNFLGSNWSGWLWPTYHPAGAMRKTEFMTAMLTDFEELGKFIRGKWKPPALVKQAPLYSLVKHGCLESSAHVREIAVDTERHGEVPFSLQYSPMAGVAYMALADHRWFFKRFNELIQDKVVILHNAPQDLDLLAKFRVYPRAIRDTMQEAFHQGDLPQKLKALAYRLLGVTWNSWDEVVRPASVDKAVEWMVEAMNIAQADLSYLDVKRYKRPICGNCYHAHAKKDCNKCGCSDFSPTLIREIQKPSPVESALKRIITHSGSPTYDIWEKMDEFWVSGDGLYDDERAYVESRLGKLPILGIGNCDLTKAVMYGCADADYTGQVARVLAQRRDSERYQIDRADAD